MSSNTNLGNTPVSQGYTQLFHTGETGGLTSTLQQVFDGDGTGSDLYLATNKVKIGTAGSFLIGSKTIQEYIQDIVGDMLVTNGSHTNLTATYDDNGDGAIDLNAQGAVTGITAGTGITTSGSGNITINVDTSTIATKTYVDTEVAGLVDSAPGTLDTLNELASALGDDPNFATTTATSLGNRLRIDTASQGLTSTQKTNALTNLGITSTSAEINVLDGYTGSVTELNYLDTLHATGVTNTEFDYLDGVTSNIQTQLNNKQASDPVLDDISAIDPASLGLNDNDKFFAFSSSSADFVLSSFPATQMSGSTNNGLLTFNSASVASVESNLTFDGTTYLEIKSSDGVEGGLRFSKSATDATHTKYHISHRPDNQTLLFYSYDGTTYRNWITLDEPNARLRLGSSTSAESEFVYVHNGRFGVGTSTPSRKLEVAGAIELSTADTTIDTNNFTLRRGASGEGFLDAPGNIQINIDTNNNQSDAFFAVAKDASNTPLFKVLESGAITFNNAYTFPTSDGTNAQVLATNGSGNLFFTNALADPYGNLSEFANISAGLNDDGKTIAFSQSSASWILGPVPITTSGTTQNGLLSYHSATTMAVESNLTFDGDFKVTGTLSSLETANFDQASGDTAVIISGTGNQRLEFRDSATGANAWIGIPSWNDDAFYLFGPTASGNEHAYTYESATHRFYTAGNEQLAIFSNGAIDMSAYSVADRHLEIGSSRQANGYAYIDLIGDTTYSDFGARFIRENGGPNTGTAIEHRGTGVLSLNAKDAGSVRFYTSNTERVRIDSSGNVSIGNISASRPLQIGFTTTNGEAIKLDGNASYGASIYYSRGGSYNWNAGVGGASSSSSNIPASYWGVEDVSQSNAVRLAIAHTTGYVGIGTNTPDAKLEVVDDNGIHLTAATGGRTLIIKPSPSGAVHEFESDNTIAGYAFSNNAGELMRINSSGNLGIGTNSPSNKIEAYGTDAGLVVHYQGNSRGGIHALSTQRIALATTASADDLVFGYGGSPVTSAGFVERMRIDNGTGNVGIGTNSPSKKFVVKGASGDQARFEHNGAVGAVDIYSGTDGGLINVRNDGSTSIINIDARNDRIQLNDSIKLVLGTNNDFEMYHDDTNAVINNTKGDLQIYNNADDKDIVLLSDDGSGGTTAYITLDGSTGHLNLTPPGNVGIGGDTPQSKLMVVTSAESSIPSAGADSAFFTIGNVASGTAQYGTMMGTLGSGNGYIQQQRFDGTATTYNLLLQPNGGNVGIGTSSPSHEMVLRKDQSAETEFSIVNLTSNSSAKTNLRFRNATSGSESGNGALIQLTNGNDFKILNQFGNNLILGTSNAEAMRITSAGRVLIGGTSASGHNYDFEVLDNHAFVKGPDGWNGTGDLAIVALGSAVVNEVFGCGYKYGTGMILSTYKSGGYGSFGSSCQDSLIIADTTGQAKFINDVVAFATSDKRLKENVKPLDSALDKIKKINGVEFDWIDGKDEHGNSVHSNEGHDIGVIAQEIEEVLPEVVTTRDNGYKAVKYEKIVPLLIQAIKEQQEQINKLEEKLNG